MSWLKTEYLTTLSVSQQNEVRKLNLVAVIMFVDYKLFSSSEISNPDLIRLEAAFNPSVHWAS